MRLEEVRTRLRIESEIIMLLAGAIAERQASRRYDHIGAQEDRRQAVNLASWHPADSRWLGTPSSRTAADIRRNKATIHVNGSRIKRTFLPSA